MFIITLKANRGTNGLYNDALIVWADNVKIEKEWEYKTFPYKKEPEKTYSCQVLKQIKITCDQDKVTETTTENPVYIVNDNNNGHWDHFYITDSRTGNIIFNRNNV